MDKLPKLVKPYYTVEETFHRLRLAGAYLNNTADIYSLAKNGMIKIELLLDGDYVLVKEKDAVPFLHTYRWRKVNTEELINDFMRSEWWEYIDNEEIESFIKQCNQYELMLFKEFVDDVISMEFEYTGQLDGCLEPDVDSCIITNSHLPILVTPLSTFGSFNFWGNTYTSEDIDVFTAESFSITEVLISVKHKENTYFVCKWQPLSDYLDKEIVGIKQNGERVRCPFWLERNALPKLLLNEKNKVISASSIKHFENQYLDQKHQDLDVEIQQNPSITVQSKREKVLEELINRNGQNYYSNHSRLDVWSILTDIDKNLFPRRDESGAPLIKSFFDKQNIIAFKRGRKG